MPPKIEGIFFKNKGMSHMKHDTNALGMSLTYVRMVQILHYDGPLFMGVCQTWQRLFLAALPRTLNCGLASQEYITWQFLCTSLNTCISNTLSTAELLKPHFRSLLIINYFMVTYTYILKKTLLLCRIGCNNLDLFGRKINFSASHNICGFLYGSCVI